MPTARTRSGSSPWRFTRHWTTIACLSALAAGLLTLAAGHPMHGWLLVLGSVMLVKGTVRGRRGRRRSDVMPMLTEPPRDADHRRWRKAA